MGIAMTSRHEPALLGSAARGDATACTRLYQRHHQTVYRYCRAMLGEDATARDATRAAMARAFAGAPDDRPSTGARARALLLARDETLARGATPAEAAAVDGDGSAAQLAGLPERQRSALVLRELCGLSHDEIAQVLACTSADAMQIVFDARSALHPGVDRRRALCAEAQRALSDREGRAPRGRRLRAHVRLCRTCAEFELATSRRPVELADLAPPLSAVAARTMLSELVPPPPQRSPGVAFAPRRLSARDRRRARRAAIAVAALATVAGGTVAFALAGDADHTISRPQPAIADARADVAATAAPTTPVRAHHDASPTVVRATHTRHATAPSAAPATNTTNTTDTTGTTGTTDVQTAEAPTPPPSAPAAQTGHTAKPRDVLSRTVRPTAERRPSRATPKPATPTETSPSSSSTSAPQAPAPQAAPAAPQSQPQAGTGVPSTSADQTTTPAPDPVTTPTDPAPPDEGGGEPDSGVQLPNIELPGG
jgi:DNA-directed RNA polymerase specialized sigma24 family protein